MPGTWNFSNLHTSDPRVLDFYATVFGCVLDDALVGMIRVPGYGDHLAATVDPDIHQRQAFAPAGFADVVAGIAVTHDRPGWQVRFTVADRDDSVATTERLGARVVSSADTQWTREAVIRDPQGSLLTLSQFTPPTP
ncbi:MAG: Glyoxalase/bleomycin resistance protein/dioxygenase [Aeromicrobium sp.]|nr:Glyoxalase/bleomycin resistance protein/dioxygenase [Aeromicrobium sp.]